MKNQDVELINRTLEGDDNAFSELVKKYQKQVHALAWRKVGDFHIAEDITQDTFLKAYQKLHTLKEPHQFAGWLYVIAARECLAWYRNKRLQKKVLEKVDTTPTNRDVYSQHISEEKAKTAEMETREVVKKLLETLKESERTIITLHYFGEMTCEEMSKFLGVSANTIKSRLRRARNRLKKEEPIIREAITNFQMSPNLTENIMQEIANTKPITPSVNKPLMPWVIGLSSAVMIALMLGVGGHYLARLQEPYSLDSQVEMEVELVEAPIVKEIEKVNDVRNQSGQLADFEGRRNGDGDNANQVSEGQGDYTTWNLPEGAKRRLGKGILNDMQFSPDGTRLAIAGTVGVWLYDVSTDDEIAILAGHTQKTQYTIPRVLFSPDSKKIATSGYDNTIRIWDAMAGKSILSIDMPKGPTRLFKVLSDGTLTTYIPPPNKVSKVGDYFKAGETGSLQITSDGSLKSLKFLQDSKTLVIQNRMGEIWLWDITSGRETASFSPKLPKPKFNEYRKWLRLDRMPGPERWMLKTDAYVNLENGSDVKFAFSVGDKNGTISIRDGQTGKEITSLSPQMPSIENRHNDLTSPIQNRVRRPGENSFIPNTPASGWVKWISKLQFSPDGKTLVSWCDYRTASKQSSGLQWYQGPTEIWDVTTGERLGTLSLFESHRSDVDVAYSRDGNYIAATSDDGCAIWDVQARREIAVFLGKTNLKFSGNSKSFASIESGNIAISDILTQHQIASTQVVAESIRLESKSTQWKTEKPVFSAISPDGSILAVVNRQGSVRLWQPHINTQLKTLTTGFTNPITALAYANNSSKLVSGDSKGNIKLWDLNTGAERTINTSHIEKPIGGLAFATDDTTITSESDGVIEVWDVNTQKKIDSYTILDAAGNGRTKMATSTNSSEIYFSYGLTALNANGGKLAAFNDFQHRKAGEKIKVWDVPTGKHLCTIVEASLSDIILALSHDGKTIATGGKNVTYLWSANTGERLATFKMSKKQKSPTGISTAVYAAAFTQDGNILAVGGRTNEKAIILWNINTQEQIATLKGHEY
ncbi:sigma-70 family RNA polymerase sigma factor, partial [Candidatus Poribacteria bacterium]|nr:sigma-70 family RNA polymerase sigma factor [Candidatus Poribacteria bacterium]